jgi:hypothetical protein
MNCVEFKKVLPEGELGWTKDQSEHMRSCSECSELSADLSLIVESARQLPSLDPPARVWDGIAAGLYRIQADLDYISMEASHLAESDEPSPRVWNSLELALRKEGLIRQPVREAVGAPRYRWFPWLVPAVAALAFVFGIVLPPHPKVPVQAALNPDDQQVVNLATGDNAGMRPVYEAGLKRTQAYIDEARKTAEQNPDNDELQQSLMDAYEQRQVVYELASNRTVQ